MSQAGSLNTVQDNPQILTQVTTDSGTAIPSANNLNIFGGAGITVTGSGDTVLISSSGFGLTWQVVTSANNPVTLVAENGYIAKGLTPVNFVLPVSASIGNAFFILGYGNLWTLSQNANQFVTLGIQTSTIGVFGGLTATTISDKAQLVCVTQNMEFTVLQPIGNIAIN
jgi:hypothetical protein